MVASDSEIDWNFPCWRRTLESYVIDGQKQFDPQSADDRAFLDSVISVYEGSS